MSSSDDLPFWQYRADDGDIHCDWRMFINDCDEHNAQNIIYIVQAIWSGIGAILAAGIVYYRVTYQRQAIFETRTPTGFIRPKPIEAMLTSAVFFNGLRMIQAIIVVADVAKNPIFRQWMYEFPWHFGVNCFACYVFGIVHTVADSSKTIYNAWFHSPKRIDMIATTYMIAPFITNNICVIISGVYASQGNKGLAEAWCNALYWFWFFYTGSLGLMVLVAGVRLLRLLSHHLRMQHDLRVNIAKIKNGAFKVKMIMLIGCSCLWGFAFIVFVYALFREPITKNIGLNLAVSVIWNFNGCLATVLVETAVILNPRMTASLGVSNVSGSGSQSDPAGLTTTDGRHITSTESGKWDKYMASSNQSHSFNQPAQDPPSTNTGSDGLPRYSISDMSMDILKNGPGNYYHGKQDGTANSNNTAAGMPSTFSVGEVEQDQLNYNATTGQVRTPPRYVPQSPFDRQPPPSQDDAFSHAGSTVSSSQLMNNTYSTGGYH